MIFKRQALFVKVLLLVIASLFLLTGSSHAQTDDGRWENGVSEPWWFDPAPMTKEEITFAKSRWKDIETENQSAVANEWSGVYFTGDETHGSYLRWSPQAGFVLMNVDKCRATVMNLDYGKVSASVSMVQLFPELNKQATGHKHAHASPMPQRFIPVRWDGSYYLVAENQMADFGNYVAGLGKYNGDEGEYMSLAFFIKLDASDKESATQFLPIVPAGYEHHLKQPIDAIITRVGKGYRRPDPENEWWDDLILPVKLNVGTAQGVKRRMTFVLLNSDRMESVLISQVGAQSSSGIIVRTIRKRPCVKTSEEDDCADPVYENLEAGRQVSTSRFRK